MLRDDYFSCYFVKTPESFLFLETDLQNFSFVQREDNVASQIRTYISHVSTYMSLHQSEYLFRICLLTVLLKVGSWWNFEFRNVWSLMMVVPQHHPAACTSLCRFREENTKRGGRRSRSASVIMIPQCYQQPATSSHQLTYHKLLTEGKKAVSFSRYIYEANIYFRFRVISQDTHPHCSI